MHLTGGEIVKIGLVRQPRFLSVQILKVSKVAYNSTINQLFTPHVGIGIENDTRQT